MMSILFKFLTLSGLLLLASCESDVKDVNTSEGASTFELSDIEKVSFATYSSDSNWPDLKDRAVVDLKVCVIDRVYLENIVGEEFKISSELGKSLDPSDANGCIHWQEKFKFDYTADETFYTIHGDIEGESNYKGARNFKLAVNPWTKEVIDLAKGGSVPKNSSISTSTYKKSLYKQLDVAESSVEFDKIEFENGEANIDMIATLKPVLLRKLIDGKRAAPTSLTGGEFEIEYLLVQREKSTNKRSIIAEHTSTVKIDEEGKLINSLTFNIENEIKTDSNLEIVMRTTPVEPSLQLESDEGYLSIESINEPNSGELKNLSMKFSAMKSLAKENKVRTHRKKVSHGIIIDSVAGISVVNHGEGNLVYNSSSRTKRSSIALKLVDSLVYKGVNSDFEIEMIDTVTNEKVYSKVRETKKALNSGVINFTPDFNFDSSFEFGYRDYIIRVRGTKSPFKNIVREKIVWVNPRLKGPGFLLDPKDHDTKPEVEDLERPEILVRDFKFDFISNDDESSYKINKNLDLVGNRVIRVAFTPELKMLNNPEGNTNPVLRTGKYRATLLILAPKEPLLQAYNRNVNLEDFDLLTGDSVDIVSEGGEVNIDFSLPHLFDEKMYLSFKNLVVLKMEPLDRNSVIRAGVTMGTIEVLRDSGFVDSIYDSREKNESEVLLAKGNKIVVDKFIKNDFKRLKNKLEDDHLISDRFEAFRGDLLQNLANLKVPVLDHENYSVKVSPVEFFVSETEERFSKNHNLKMTPREVEEMIVNLTISDANLKDLCKLFYNPEQVTEVMYEGATGGGTISLPHTVKHKGREFERCKKNPYAHIDLNELKFVDKILQQPKELRANLGDPTVKESSRNLQRSEAYFVSKGEMFSKIDGARESNYVGLGNHTSVDMSSKLLGGPLSFFTALGPDIGTRTDYYSMSQDSLILSNQRRIINQDGLTFTLSEVNAQFEARIKKCLLISPKYVKDEIPQRYVSTFRGLKAMWNEFTKNDTRVMITSPKRHLVCMKFNRDEILSEMWYFVRLSGNTNDGNSDMSLAKNSVGSIIRGRKAYEEFRILDLENDKRIVIHPDSTEEVVRRYKNFNKNKGKDIQYKDRVGIGYPGLIEEN